jgi:hypothetical protein
VQDIPDALDQHHPNILHFSGHANAHGLLFEDDQGKSVLVEQTYLANLLRGQENLKLVFLNACYVRASTMHSRCSWLRHRRQRRAASPQSDRILKSVL